MKLQLDFDNKSVTIEGDVSISDFIKRIKVILPDWKEWKLITNTTIYNWQNPYYVPYTPTIPFWDSSPWITCCDTNGTDTTVTTGTYNVEFQMN